MHTDGVKIKELRKSMGLTQVEFAKSIGITQSFLSSVENGHFNVSKSVAMLIDIKYRNNIKPVEAVEIDISDTYEGENLYRDEPIPPRKSSEKI